MPTSDPLRTYVILTYLFTLGLYKSESGNAIALDPFYRGRLGSSRASGGVTFAKETCRKKLYVTVV